jgi:hypothetical protein
MDGHKILQMFMYHESLKIESNDKRFTETVNMYNGDLKDHYPLLMLNLPI